MKRILILFLSLLLTIAATGCSPRRRKQSGTPEDTPADSNENPFQTGDDLSAGIDSIGHDAVNPNRDKDGKKLPFEYNGGEISIPYEVHASGKTKEIGFLLYIDGIAQPYKVDGSDAACEYMHIFNLKENDKEHPFTFIFEPVTGKKGDTLSMGIVSVYAPGFMPDMKKASGYGMYHSTLLSDYELHFNQDAKGKDASAMPKYPYLKNVKQATEPITQDYLDSLSVFSGMVPITLELLNKEVFSQQFLNGQGGLIDNLKVNEDGTLHVTFKIMGYPGARYKSTFYINHKAITDGKNTSFETVLTKGNVSVIEADLELSQLEDFNTFYVVSALCNVQELWEDGTSLLKTPSVLLYKK